MRSISGVSNGDRTRNHRSHSPGTSGGRRPQQRQQPDAGADIGGSSRDLETWLPVIGWPRYEVSSRGRVRVRGFLRCRRQQPNHRGYMRVMLADGRRRKNARVHVLVAEAFHGRAPIAGATVDHLDQNKRNNCAENLEWCTRLENYRRHLKRLREALQDTLDLFAPPVRQGAA